jgi:hypothetical protein
MPLHRLVHIKGGNKEGPQTFRLPQIFVLRSSMVSGIVGTRRRTFDNLTFNSQSPSEYLVLQETYSMDIIRRPQLDPRWDLVSQ